MINSEEYWNELFKEDAQNLQREQQTRFFVRLALENMPRWLVEDIQDDKMSICDIGCAEGVGTDVLAREFRENKVVGMDFSPQAIKIAEEKYSLAEYKVGDIKNIKENYDVLFSSNVLEHFWHSKDVLEKMIKFADKYCILLIPFREYYTVSEHASYFDFQSFPLELLGEYTLCYYKPITIKEEDVKYWFGEQILVVYGKKSYVCEKNFTLKHMYNGYVEERTQIIQQYDAKIEKYDIKIQQYDEDIKQYEKRIEQITDAYNNEKDKNVLMDAYKERIENFDKLIESAMLTRDKQIASYEMQLQDMSIDYENVKQAIECIQNTQNSRVYKNSLVWRRFYFQFIKNREKKEFLKWAFAKAFRKKYSGRALSYFDYLETAKERLRDTKAKLAHTDTQQNEVGYELKRKDISKTVVIFASVPFYDVGGGQRSAQLAKTFNELGYIVHYIYGFECSEENVPDMFIPTATHKYIDEVTVEWYKSILMEGSITIFEIPYVKFQPYLKAAKLLKQHTVYEHIDNWDSNLGSMFYDADIFEQFMEDVDLITVTARMLGEKIVERSKRDFIYLPNAVNINIFEPGKKYECPADLIKGKSKTLLYFGSLWGEWFDWEKIIYIAEHCKDVAINLIGDYSGIKDKINSLPNNIYFLGLKKQTDLPAYLQHIDIALLPFKNCEIGKYVSPLKIFEYIAMNKKVLATNLDDIRDYPNVYASDSKEEWLEIVKRDDVIQSTEQFIAQNNWYSRCAAMIEYFQDGFRENMPSISIVVLNYNNKNVIERCVKTLLTHNRRYQYEIIVVDNGSTDGSYEVLKEKYGEEIKLVQNQVNGCSSGRNLGAKEARGEYLFFLDSDQWVISDYWLDSAISLLKNNVQIGAVAWNAGWFEPGKTTGPIVDYLPNRGMEKADMWYRTDIAYLATSGFLVKKDLFDSVEGFDEYYDPTCFEDTDISLKIRYYGLELAYCPYMAIMHLPHQTTQSGSARHTQLMKKNGEYFWNKWKERNPKLLEYYKD